MKKALYDQKAEDRKSKPSDVAGQVVERADESSSFKIGGKCRIVEQEAQNDRSGMVDKHCDNGDHFQRTA